VSPRPDREAAFRGTPPVAALPGWYPELLTSVAQHIATGHRRAVAAANAELLAAYWAIGREILDRQHEEGYGTKVIDRLSADLKERFPDARGYSPRNLKNMRAFAAAWPDPEVVQQPVAQLPWGHHVVLLDKLDSPELRLHTLPEDDSDLAQQATRDPYLFDFLSTAETRHERDMEQGLMNHISRFLLELGQGFAFVGRQVRLTLEGDEFYCDLLFYHLGLRCYVVIELKTVKFDPAFLGQLAMYRAVVDDLLARPDDKPTIGLLLCKTKKNTVVEYALRDFTGPIGVAEYATAITTSLPDELRGSLPSIAELESELAAAADDLEGE
jgi:predicted nuclease of restriction endonuclease-like (RecB) superfamily